VPWSKHGKFEFSHIDGDGERDIDGNAHPVSFSSSLRIIIYLACKDSHGG
jgi:hypothetical protein